MPTLATCTVVGHLTADPEPIPGQDRAVRFRVWTSDKPKKDAEKVFTHFRCAMFGPQAEWLLRDGKKSMLVALTGTFRLDSYEKNDGTKGQALEVRCSDARLLERNEAAPEVQAQPRKPAAAAAADDDLSPPF